MNNTYREFKTLDHVREFREISDKISGLATNFSLQVIGYHSPELPLYSQMSEQKQATALSQLKVFLQTMESAAAAGESLDDSGRSLWHALSTLRLIPPSGMFSYVRPDHVIEIYNLENVQIWRSLNFHKFCSYTLEEMYSIEWTNRYRRDPGKVEECIEKVTSLVQGKTPDIYFTGIAEHTLDETSSSLRLILRADHEWLGRLKDQSGVLTAYIVASSVKLLGRSIPK
jgi:hypothetical protein